MELLIGVFIAGVATGIALMVVLAKAYEQHVLAQIARSAAKRNARRRDRQILGSARTSRRW